MNPNLCVHEGKEAATNSEGAVCNHDQTELLDTQRVHAVSARFEARKLPLEHGVHLQFSFVSVHVCFTLCKESRATHRFDMSGCAPSKPACSCRSPCVGRLFADGSTSRESGRELGGSRLHTTCVDLTPAPSTNSERKLVMARVRSVRRLQ